MYLISIFATVAMVCRICHHQSWSPLFSLDMNDQHALGWLYHQCKRYQIRQSGPPGEVFTIDGSWLFKKSTWDTYNSVFGILQEEEIRKQFLTILISNQICWLWTMNFVHTVLTVLRLSTAGYDSTA
jgi:hypothetical protein